MKGVSFQNGVEFKVVIDGESWSQGGPISGQLEMAVRGASAVAPPSIHVYLANSTDRRVKAKAANAFEEIVFHASAEASSLKWSFDLPLDARITDKAGSIFLLYGSAETPAGDSENLGQLRLNILPHLHLRDLIEVMNTHFRFTVKSLNAIKSPKKDYWIEVKMNGPSAREWTSLEFVTIDLKLTEETIEANYSFHRTEIDGSKPGVSKVNVVREIERSWNLKEMLHDFNQRLNKDVAIASIENVIAEYQDRGWLKS